MTKYQKVIRVRNNVAMTLDQMFIQQSGIKVGDSLAASYMPENRLFSVAQVKKAQWQHSCRK